MMKKDYEKFAEAIKMSRAEAKKSSPECEVGVEILASKVTIR